MAIPIYNILLALGGIVIVLIAFLIILRAHKQKKSQAKFQNRFSGIKQQFNDIKEDATNEEEDDWLKIKQKQDSNKYNALLEMNEK